MAENSPVRVAGLPAVSGPPSPTEWESMKQQASMIARSGLAPKAVSTPEKVLVIAMKGRELSIPPMQALSQIHIVEGKPTLSSELMVALVRRAGHKVRIIESNAERCTVEGVRADDPDFPQQITWTMDDAKRAGVAGKTNWKNYPTAMLLARAISALCRFLFADVLMGASYTPEELGADEVGYEVNGDGEPSEAPRDETAANEQPKNDDANEDIEDAEVVEDDEPAPEPVSQSDTSNQGEKVTNDQLRALREKATTLYGEDGIRELQKRIGGQLHHLYSDKADQLLDRLEAAIQDQDKFEAEPQSEGDNSDSPTDKAGDEVDLDEDDIQDMERMASGSQGGSQGAASEEQPQEKPKASDHPARKSQVDLLKTLSVELRGKDGVARLEETIGKPLSDLTRAEAEEWISRITPEED